MRSAELGVSVANFGGEVGRNLPGGEEGANWGGGGFERDGIAGVGGSAQAQDLGLQAAGCHERPVGVGGEAEAGRYRETGARQLAPASDTLVCFSSARNLMNCMTHRLTWCEIHTGDQSHME